MGVGGGEGVDWGEGRKQHGGYGGYAGFAEVEGSNMMTSLLWR